MATLCKADRGIHQIPGLQEIEVRGLLSRLEGDKSRAARSLRRECRLWFKRNRNAEPQVKRYSKVSDQDGIAEKLIVAVD